MREALIGHSRTSVPSVRPNATPAPDTRWNSGGAFANAGPNANSAATPWQGGGGSFLGTAAATAAGVIGGSLLLNSISSMFGQRGGSAFADVPPSGSPWDNSAAGSDIAREAGVNDIGRGAHGAVDDPQAAGLFGGDDPNFDDDIAGDPGGDFGGDFGGGDTA